MMSQAYMTQIPYKKESRLPGIRGGGILRIHDNCTVQFLELRPVSSRVRASGWPKPP